MSKKLVHKIPISSQKRAKGFKPKVSIVCHSYNQEDYIEDAIRGFLMQKTTFPVDIIINDDCSSDNTSNIIKKYHKLYPKIIKPIYRSKRIFLKKNFSTDLYIQAKGDYIAYCDGDDFWTSANKLQKQFETLEKYSNHIFCGHLTENFIDVKMNRPKFVSIDYVIREKFICHSSSFFFKNVFKKINKAKLPEYLFYGFNGDYALTFFLMQNSSCIILPYIMSSYRINDKGSYRSLNSNGNIGLLKKAQSMLHIRQMMKYHLGPNEYLNISKKNFIYILSIIKRSIFSINLFELVKSIGIFGLLLIEYISSSILLHLQKKYKKY
jgi:glycosyltransferase involved in cell wall biosynthesis